jgi:hypothetical protein
MVDGDRACSGRDRVATGRAMKKAPRCGAFSFSFPEMFRRQLLPAKSPRTGHGDRR